VVPFAKQNFLLTLYDFFSPVLLERCYLDKPIKVAHIFFAFIAHRLIIILCKKFANLYVIPYRVEINLKNPTKCLQTTAGNKSFE
jgi:hypothetical protein